MRFELEKLISSALKCFLPGLCLAVLIAMSVSCTKGGGDTKDEPVLAPQFVLQDISGGSLSLADYRGKIVVLEFFATWCEPCRYTAPVLQTLSARYKNKDVAIVGIAIDDGNDVPVKLKAFMKEYKLTYPVAMDNGHVKKQYDAYALPTTVIIDRGGRIVKKHYGITQNHLKKLSEEIEQSRKL